MKRREPIELRKLKPETLSARLTHVHSVLKGDITRLYTALKATALDDDWVTSTDEGKDHRKKLFVLKGKLEGIAHWLAHLRNEAKRFEAAERADKKLKQLGVNPEEVLARD